MSHLEAGITEARFFTDPRHAGLTEPLGAFGPNIGVDGRNLTITFLSLDRAALSIRLLRSIAGHLPRFGGKILIADNGSRPEELASLKSFLTDYPFPYRLIELNRNFGVAGGRNLALAEVETAWAMSLDNDIYFVANPLTQIQKDLAILGCHFLDLPLLNPGQSTLYAFGGHLQTLTQNGRQRLTITTIVPPNSPASVVREAFGGEDGFLCSFLFGGASVLNVDSFKRIGGFDDKMFIGFEDIDFSLRLFRAGMKVGATKELALVHDHPKAENESSEDYERMRHSRQILEASARYLEDKHGYAIWGDEIDSWLRRMEEAQGFAKSASASAASAHAPSKTLPRIALITDTEDWAFSNISHQLVRHLGDRYSFEIIPLVQLGELEEARWLKGGCKGHYAPGGSSAFGQALLLAEEFDIVHVFWREFLTLIDTPLLHAYAESLGLSYGAFRRRFIEGKFISTSVYDHLFLEPDALEKRRPIFNDIASAYFVSSEKLKAIYEQIEGYTKPAAVIEDGVDLTLFKPSNLDRFNSITGRDIIIGWVGNSRWAAPLEDFKGVQSILIPAVEQLRAEGLPIRLELADRHQAHIPHHRMPAYYAGIDLYVCTSKIEGTPNPVLESMACGVPVISTDVGIVPQAFGPLQREFILAERSIECLKAAIRRLVSRPDRFAALSAENLQQIKSWDWSLQTKKFARYFDALLMRRDLVKGTNRTKMCMLPFQTPSVETDGSIRLCSAASIFAHREETNMGNSRKDGLEAVWRGPKYRRVRETLLTGQNLRPYCDACEYRFDGPAWLLQLHLALHAYEAGIRSEKLLRLIDAHRDKYETYCAEAPRFLLPVLPLPSASGNRARPLPKTIRPAPPEIPEELIDGGQLPISLDLNTLNRCNVSCVMCPPALKFDSQGRKRDPYFRLTLADYQKITAGLPVKVAHFVGAYAEPLLNKEIFALVGHAKRQGTFTAITSNGMALSPSFAEKLLDAGLDMITISLHGARKETAERVMRKSNFDRIVSNIRSLQDLKRKRALTHPEIYFNYVGMKSNASDLPDFVGLAADLDVRHIHFIHLIDGDEAVDKDQSLSDDPDLLVASVTEARRRAAACGVNLYVSSAYQDVIDRHLARDGVS